MRGRSILNRYFSHWHAVKNMIKSDTKQYSQSCSFFKTLKKSLFLRYTVIIPHHEKVFDFDLIFPHDV